MTDLPPGLIKRHPEDFVVEELPAYAPAGEGTHVFVRFTKTDRTTVDAGRAIARALECDPRAAGFAGMKDKRAVTIQTISLETPRGTTSAALAERARGLTLPGIVVHEATPHGHKMKAGHLAGNRFTIAVRDVPRGRMDEVERSLARVASEGVPNAFGAQRFGNAGDNAARAVAWLTGKERGPRDPRMQRLLWSSLQSAVFNAVLDARVADGTWTTALEGDLLKLRSSGGLFLCSNVQTDRERAATGEVSATGPMIGARMRWPEGGPAELERRIAAATLGEGFDLAATRRLGEGTRRPLRMWVQDLRWERTEQDGGHAADCVRVYFVLPKGAYATTVLASVFTLGHTPEPTEAREEERQDDNASEDS
ncbi:MAG: tRNA pseudouridine(13) synthase TruD [Polyangiaceae bacterium]|jgi:tRNA pseudouridine13 synthase